MNKMRLEDKITGLIFFALYSCMIIWIGHFAWIDISFLGLGNAVKGNVTNLEKANNTHEVCCSFINSLNNQQQRECFRVSNRYWHSLHDSRVVVLYQCSWMPEKIKIEDEMSWIGIFGMLFSCVLLCIVANRSLDVVRGKITARDFMGVKSPELPKQK